jgi:ectoine hydroxylase
MWTQQELKKYDEDGFLIRRGLLNSNEVAALLEPLPRMLDADDAQDGLHREREKSGPVRQVYLVHRHSPPYKELARNPKLLEPVKQILQNDVYIWHSKINVKDAFEGAVWLWHQDYGYWFNDGVDAKFVSVMVCLDESTLNNGCFMVAAGTHKWGRVPHHTDTVTTSYKQWCIDVPYLKEHLKEEMIQPITGKPGDAIFFHPNLIHGSGHNMSPLPRKSIIMVYNDIRNKPRPVENPRPDWVVARQFDPIS